MDLTVATVRRARLVPLATLMACSLLLAACGDKKETTASQTAAKVNKDEITVHQINFVLQQQRGLRPEQADAASRQILERLIDQELAVQQADALKLDRDPRVVQQLEAVKREVLARAYAEKVGEAASRPTPEDIKAYYDANPALFAERRVYSLQELRIEAPADQVGALRERLQASKNINEFVEFLRGAGLRFNANQAVRAAEQLPLASLKAFAQMKDGQAVFNAAPNGAVVIVLAGSRSQPVGEEQARPAIEQFLLNQRKRELLEQDRKRLRADATVQYVGKFAEGAPPAAEAASAPAESGLPSLAPAGEAAMPPAAPASAGLDPADISKGLGLK
ncbi:EpsD family peptidyl-prolyl cis-trans isomerase [Rubrivivax albus]|uniref:Peptidyl-prolyl cis-trans isomerase, EpsD family n=1 Tax=Rubrivivax albus TaxID=2499835 RepID=A0A437K047_9BURK|nr:EpsD family peptidyl-prolyl cis-trans isomerase [Rubrivivax albus]RVT53661.1 peptidyl-prolyl cis-trans isomerase, EpsD family [Rubrivivax albus]